MFSLMEPFHSPSGCLFSSRNCLDVWLALDAFVAFSILFVHSAELYSKMWCNRECLHALKVSINKAMGVFLLFLSAFSETETHKISWSVIYLHVEKTDSADDNVNNRCPDSSVGADQVTPSSVNLSWPSTGNKTCLTPGSQSIVQFNLQPGDIYSTCWDSKHFDISSTEPNPAATHSHCTEIPKTATISQRNSNITRHN